MKGLLCGCCGKGWYLYYKYGVIVCADHEEFVDEAKLKRLQKRYQQWVIGYLEKTLGVKL